MDLFICFSFYSFPLNVCNRTCFILLKSHLIYVVCEGGRIINIVIVLFINKGEKRCKKWYSATERPGGHICRYIKGTYMPEKLI